MPADSRQRNRNRRADSFPVVLLPDALLPMAAHRGKALLPCAEDRSCGGSAFCLQAAG